MSGRRRDLYLGAWRSPVSKAEYARIVAIISANGGIFPSSADDLTVNEALVLYTRHITACYVEPDGSPSRSVENMFVATAPADLRRSFDGLMGLVRDFLGGDPLSGHLFVFRNRIGDRLKVLWWDRDGLAIFYKRLEEGTFAFPAATGDVPQVEMTAADMQLVLQGIDPAKVRRVEALPATDADGLTQSRIDIS